MFSAIKEMTAEFSAMAAANVFVFNLPPIIGLGSGRDLNSSCRAWAERRPKTLPQSPAVSIDAANLDPRLASVFTTYGAATPQIILKIDRERAETLGIAIKDIFSALQTAMGGTYVNDFNLFGRTWQVKVQADAADRATVNDVFRVRLRTAQRRSGALADGRRCRVDHRAHRRSSATTTCAP